MRSPAPTAKGINGEGGSGRAVKMIMVLMMMTMMTMIVMTMTVCPTTVDALVPPMIKQPTSASSRLTFTTTTRRQMSSASTTPSSSSSSTSTSTSSKTTTTNKKTTSATKELITNESKTLADAILQQMEDESLKLGLKHSEMYGLDEDEDDDEDEDSSSRKTTTTCAGLYALLHAISKTATLGLKGQPFVVRKSELERIMMLVMSSSSSQSSSSQSEEMNKMFASCFTMDDLELALEDDFLDAARGSTDKNKAWQITTVSEPLGDSFEEARMTIEDVNKALELGTVIFNAAGAHIPKLAGPCLSVTDATSTPNAVNLYLTKTNKPTSAPPHTDKQDVVVVQSTGVKHWKVYGPPDPSLKPQADPFARGKMTDALPLHRLEATSPLLLETDLRKGDVLFVPGGFPHTTSTTIPSDDDDDDDSSRGDDDGGNVEVEENSLHLTFNIDHLVWDLSNLSARRLALRRSHVRDPLTTGDNSVNNNENDSNIAVYVGGVNKLPLNIHQDIMAEIPLGFLDDDDDDGQDGEGAAKVSVEDVTAELKRVSKLVDEESFSQVPDEVWMGTVERLQQHGKELLDIHRDMYLAALDEGRQRILDDKMTAHLLKDDVDNNSGGRRKRKPMTPERMQRLSLFRVQRYYEKVDRVKNELLTWSYEGQPASTVGSTGGASTDGGGGGGGGSSSPQAIPADWAFTMPVSVGDQVEADLGGAFFPATVVSVDPSGSSYNVQFFDGDRETLDRSSIKLLKPPKITSSSVDDIDTTGLTPKQIKRLKKQQQKKNKK